MDKIDALEHSVRALLASLTPRLLKHNRTAFFNDEKLRFDCMLLFAQWKDLQEALNYTVPPALEKLSADMQDFLAAYMEEDDHAATQLEERILEHAKNIGLALRPTGLHTGLRPSLPFECRKLFAMYACFKSTADPAKHDLLGVADTLVGLFELYVQYPLPPPAAAVAINKHDDRDFYSKSASLQARAMPTLSALAAKATADNLRTSIAAIAADMRKTPLSIEERRAIHSRCKALFTQLEALRESDAFDKDQPDGMLDIMFKMNDLFENFLNLVPLTPTAYCAMH